MKHPKPSWISATCRGDPRKPSARQARRARSCPQLALTALGRAPADVNSKNVRTPGGSIAKAYTLDTEKGVLVMYPSVPGDVEAYWGTTQVGL